MKKLFFYVYFVYLLLVNVIFSQPKRVISLTPSITQELYFLEEGKSVVGITSFCKRINKEQQIVGTYLQPNIEKILNLKPDIIFLSKEGISKDVVDLFEKFGLKYVVLEPVNTYDDLKNQLILISKFFDKKDFALKKIRDLEKKYIQVVGNKTNILPKVIFAIDNEMLIVASRTSYIGEILNYAGVENVVLTEKKYPQLSVEELTKLDPDILLVSDMGMKENKIKKYFKKFRWLKAVKNNRVIVVDSNIFCQPTVENFWYSVEKVKSLVEK